jgi:uncharacterized membrane protein affecting hemolysin expression
MNSRTIRYRIILAIAVPWIISAIASTWLIATYTRDQLTDQANQFGQAIADQLANTSIDYLVSKDVLSLNVILDELYNRNNFDFAAVYNPENNLLAQSGKHSNGQYRFTRDINFQDTNLGHVMIKLDSSELELKLREVIFVSGSIHGVLILLTLGLIWFYGDLFYLWLTHTKSTQERVKIPIYNLPPEVERPTEHRTLLALRMKPARLVPVGAIKDAATLFSANIESINNEEWLLTFNTRDQLENCIRCGLLITEIAFLQTGNVVVKAGIDSAPEDDLAMLRKQVSYLASVSDQNLLVSQRVNQMINSETGKKLTGQVETHQFHSSLTGDGEVYVVEGLDTLAKQQAKKLMSKG